MKLIFLIIASNEPEHLRDEQTQKETWAKNLSNNVLWLRGASESYLHEESRTLYVKVEDVYTNILEKTILGIKWCVENLEFDFLVRANVSTYFDEKTIEEILHKYNPEKDFFGGFIDFYQSSNANVYRRIFVNGGALFLSRKTAKRIENLASNEWQNVPDDVAISQFLMCNGVAPTKITRGNIAKTGAYRKRAYYRLKSSSNAKMATLRMRNIHNIHTTSSPLKRIRYYKLFYRSEMSNFRENFTNVFQYMLSLYSLISSSVYTKLVMIRSHEK